MYKNTGGQKLIVWAWNVFSSAWATGEAANITAYISKDGATPAASNDANPTELDSTNMPGAYVFDLTQAETNCDLFAAQPSCSTANIVMRPFTAFTRA